MKQRVAGEWRTVSDDPVPQPLERFTRRYRANARDCWRSAETARTEMAKARIRGQSLA
jgi:hypothetical protein